MLIGRHALRHAAPRAVPFACLVRTRPRGSRAAAVQGFAAPHRCFASAPVRRKDTGADDVPDPIPRETKKENSDRRSSSEGKSSDSKGNSGSSAAGGSSRDDGKGSSNSSGDGGRRSGRRSSAERSLQKPTVPEVYPQLLGIPITKRPFFPGFYKALTIYNPQVRAAFREMVKRGQPYVGLFLLKDENADKDVIESIDEVHDVGVFAQITSQFSNSNEDDVNTPITAVVYPHRRIKMTSLMPPPHPKRSVPTQSAASSSSGDSKAEDGKATDESVDKKGNVVASFEEAGVSGPGSGSFAPSYEPTAFLRDFKVSLVNVENLPEQPFDASSPVIRAMTSEIVNSFKEIALMNPLFRDQVSTFSTSQSAGNMSEEPGILADFAAAVTAGEVAELQDILETMDIESRLNKAMMMLKKELMNAQLQNKISQDVEKRIHKRQREYYLTEQMKAIRRELGIESDGKEKLIEGFRERAAKLAMPEAVHKVFDEEISKLQTLETASSEFNVTRNYLDWITRIPWGQRSAENFDIRNATTVLEEDHYGLKDVKDRILEFIAVGKLRGTVEGKILCLVGPPGVGKTSIAKSIARALNRQYYRFSVGGLTDVAEIKGHRRTYVGALPGRIIQALKKCQTENPLVTIDEVDKIGRGHHGDPSSALLELLDPEQNNSFLDHYMDLPVDLSKVLFVCTANMTQTIPQPLLDRMEIISLSGYVADEKLAIAEKYLAPQAKETSGLKDANVNLHREAIEELIKSYCRESGVRNLKKQIEKLYRKSALNIVKDLGEEVLSEDKALTVEGKAALEEAKKDDSDVTKTPDSIEHETTTTPRVKLDVPADVNVDISLSNLKDYVGPPIYTADRLYDRPPPGVVMGLAWTAMGGAAMYVETILETALGPHSRPGFERTGNLKSVMRESSQIAYSFAKGVMAKDFPENRFFEKARLHLHCPEGGVPKDGPSAGITMATSLLSLALDFPLDPGIAMTGELTVTGKVLRIGGLREKTVAARRAGATDIIFPEGNMSDWLELPENIKQGLQGHPVSWYREVFDLIFKDLDRDAARTRWKKQLSGKKKAQIVEDDDPTERSEDEDDNPKDHKEEED